MAIIRASEVGEYVYCARAWWLRRVEGLEPAHHKRREAGTRMHRRHSHMVRSSSMLVGLAGVLLLLALLLLFAP